MVTGPQDTNLKNYTRPLNREVDDMIRVARVIASNNGSISFKEDPPEFLVEFVRTNLPPMITPNMIDADLILSGIFNDINKSNDPALAGFNSTVKAACASAPKIGASESKYCDLPSECELEATRAVLARGNVSAAAKRTVMHFAAGCVVNITNALKKNFSMLSG